MSPLGPHTRTATKFCLDNGALRDFDDPPVSAAVRGAAAAPAGNNKQANSTSPEEEVHLNDLPQFSSMHFPVVLQLLAIVIGFFFLCMTRGQRVGHSEHIYLAEGSHVTLHAKRCWLPWRGAAAAAATAAAASLSISGRLTDRTTGGIALPYGVIATMYLLK